MAGAGPGWICLELWISHITTAVICPVVRPSSTLPSTFDLHFQSGSILHDQPRPSSLPLTKEWVVGSGQPTTNPWSTTPTSPLPLTSTRMYATSYLASLLITVVIFPFHPYIPAVWTRVLGISGYQGNPRCISMIRLPNGSVFSWANRNRNDTLALAEADSRKS